MTETVSPLYRNDAYAREAAARVTGYTDEGGIILDTGLFYPTGGGQPGDSGWIDWDGVSLAVATTVKGPVINPMTGEKVSDRAREMREQSEKVEAGAGE